MKSIHQIFADYFDDDLKEIAFAVSQKLEEGHVCLDLKSYNNTANRKWDATQLLKQEMVTDNPDEELQPFVLVNGKFYLQRYYLYESRIVKKLKRWLNAEENTALKESINTERDFLKALFPPQKTNDDFELKINWQMVAVLNAAVNRFTIITGGPGTGKTTTVAKFLALRFHRKNDLRVALAAPTGKAAARLNESLAGAKKHLSIALQAFFETIKAQTIHRLLGVKYGTPYFRYNADNPLPYDVVVVDESSMIDVALMAKLFDAVGDETQLLLLGDKNQLASVEAGSVFGDLCKIQPKANAMKDSDRDFYNRFLPADTTIPQEYVVADNKNNLLGHIVELKRSYRFNDNEGIGKFSRLVIDGVLDKSHLINDFQDCANETQCVQTALYDTPLVDDYLADFRGYAEEKDIAEALRKLNKIKLLCAVREGEYGVYAYNRMVERYLRKHNLLGEPALFYHNQPVMITANDYSKQLFNGDIGLVRWDETRQVLMAYFFGQDGEVISFRPEFLSAWETVFAMTIHKSQGSEFDKVVVVLPNDTQQQILTRELLYTAVTRAKQKVLVLTTEEVLLRTVKRKVDRVSGIEEQMNEKAEEDTK